MAAMRCGSCTSAAARVLRIITSLNMLRRYSGFFGDFGLPGVTYALRNSASVASRPGFSSVIRLYSSMRLFSTGVAVSIRMNFLCSESTSCQLALARFLRQCASSTITISQATAPMAAAFASSRAAAMEATTRGSSFQKRAGLARNCAESGETATRPNFSISSPFH